MIGFRKGFKFDNSQIVLVPFVDNATNSPAVGKDIYFNVNEYLSRQKIKAIQVITQEEQPNLVQNGQATPVLNKDTNSQVTVTFVGKDAAGNKVTHFYKTPVVRFNITSMGGIYFMCDDININFGKSFITLNSITGISIGKYIYFVFYF